MDIKPVCLVLTDISGYTRFLRFRRLSLLHAEEIISSLLETIVENAEYPLTLSKFEGDAVFLYAIAEPDKNDAAQDVLRQVTMFFDAFRSRQEKLIRDRDGGCLCEACRHIDQLRLKTIVHFGSALFKKIRQFDELAGEDVILLHRLLKNTIPEREYIALTRPYRDLLRSDALQTTERNERVDDFGTVDLFVHYPQTRDVAPQKHAPLTRWRGIIEVFRTTARALRRKTGGH